MTLNDVNVMTVILRYFTEFDSFGLGANYIKLAEVYSNEVLSTLSWTKL